MKRGAIVLLLATAGCGSKAKAIRHPRCDRVLPAGLIEPHLPGYRLKWQAR